MAKPTLEDWEVALIKAMLARGFPNKTIQFYFNRPDRSVNSGRISEIKGEDRWVYVEPADDHDLDEFLDHHPYAQPLRPDGEPEMPQQKTAASRFRIEDDGLVSISPELPDGEGFDGAEASEAYAELRNKVRAMLDLGDNHIAQVRDKVVDLSEVLPEAPAEASPIRVWMRGNSLRGHLRAHNEASDLDPYHPARLEPHCANHLSDIVDAFNVLAAVAQRLADFDQARLGPDVDVLRDAVAKFDELLPEAKDISTAAASDELKTEIDILNHEQGAEEAGRQIQVAGGTVYNFLLTAIKGVYREIRKTVGGAISEVWLGAKIAVGGLVTQQVGSFLLHHYPVIREIMDQLSSNPVVHRILELIVTVLS